jgi:hypothetical protein
MVSQHDSFLGTIQFPSLRAAGSMEIHGRLAVPADWRPALATNRKSSSRVIKIHFNNYEVTEE